MVWPPLFYKRAVPVLVPALCNEIVHNTRLILLQVHMQGMAVGRAVDLTRFDGYEDLLRKLEEMFDIEGELCGPTKKWLVVYTDNEDDRMMVGDDPWLEFCGVVRKIFIYTPEEVKKLSPKIGLLTNEEGKPSKLDSEAVMNPEDQSSIVGPGC